MIDTTAHLPECYLAKPCRSAEDGHHVSQEFVGGFPVTICGLCMSDCICSALRECESRVRLESLTYHEAIHGERGFIAGMQAARDIIAAIHSPYTDSLDPDPDARYCESCGTEWPCSNLTVIDVLIEQNAATQPGKEQP